MMAFANGQNIKSLFLGGEKFVKELIGQTVTITKEHDVVDSNGGGYHKCKVGDKYVVCGMYLSSDNSKVYALKIDGTIYLINEIYCTLSGGYSLPRLFTCLRNIFAPQKVVA